MKYFESGCSVILVFEKPCHSHQPKIKNAVIAARTLKQERVEWFYKSTMKKKIISSQMLDPILSVSQSQIKSNMINVCDSQYDENKNDEIIFIIST